METSIWKILLYIVIILVFSFGSTRDKIFKIGQPLNLKGIAKFILDSFVLITAMLIIFNPVEGYEISPFTFGKFTSILVVAAGTIIFLRSVISIYKRAKPNKESEMNLNTILGQLVDKGTQTISVKLGGTFFEKVNLESVITIVATCRSNRINMKYQDNTVIVEPMPSATKKLEIVGDHIQYIN